MTASRYAGPAAPLSLGAIAAAAADLRCAPAALVAIVTVETGMRSGFLPDARPRILYEAHIARRLCGRDAPGLSVKSWDRSLYAPTGGGEYERLYRAVDALGETVALQAASWGMGQVLGVNHALCGYSSVQSFVDAMGRGEDEHLSAMVAFIASRKLIEAVRRLSPAPEACRAFAAGYNGTAFQKNAYHEKLARAYARAVGDVDPQVLEIGDYGPEVASLQRALIERGAQISADGAFGRMTRIALEAYQADAGLPVTGRADLRVAAALGFGAQRRRGESPEWPATLDNDRN